jgi:uncharacterized protein DUF2799
MWNECWATTVKSIMELRIALSVLTCALLAGCAIWPLSEADCRPASWQQRGYDDGYFGNLPQDLRLLQECSRFGIQVAQNEYLAGWRDGYDEWDRLMGSMRKKSR